MQTDLSGKFDFVLIGHSHSVAFLDGVTNWRAAVRGANEQRDHRYDSSFQGWHSGGFPDDLLQASITDSKLSTGSILLRVFTATSKLTPKAAVVTIDGKPSLAVDEDFREFLSKLPKAVPIISFLRGNEHALMMLGHLPPYDFVDESVGEYDDTGNVVPIDSSVIDSHINRWVNEMMITMMSIKAITNSPIAHVLPPPPREQPERARFLESIESLVHKYGFAPDSIRLKWYYRYCRILSGALKEIGCTTFTPPVSTLTCKGLLKEEYADGLTHGNSKYGKELAKEIYENLKYI